MNQFTLHHGDCLEALKAMPDSSVDSIVTDPPYGLSFMGKKWDYDVPGVDVWSECLRVLKPGGYLLAFAGTRTQHRMAVRIEDAGFEIRDMIAWVYGSGFPKSLDVSKAIDKAAGAEREVLGPGSHSAKRTTGSSAGLLNRSSTFAASVPMETAPATESARQWQGWGTALKPALEPITVARKPLVGTVAENVLAHGTGAINVDACRVPLEEDCRLLKGGTYGGNRGSDKGTSMFGTNTKGLGYEVPSANGRWPANLIHDGSDEVVGAFPVTGPSNVRRPTGEAIYGGNSLNSTVTADTTVRGVSDNGGSAARFFYCAKASKKDRGEGNAHPTVKPTDLMRYLCRLVTPPGGVVLDPFMGSGSTGKAAVLEGFRFVGCELSADYLAIARHRIEHALALSAPQAGEQMSLLVAEEVRQRQGEPA